MFVPAAEPGPDPEATAASVAASMVSYCARRAATYEQVYAKPERQADLRAMEAWLASQFNGRRVLEIACGTGWWTGHGAAGAAHWRATDLNPETMDVARHKTLPAGIVQFQTLDAYTLDGLQREDHFDAAFAGFWWSHVPLARLPGWLDTLHNRLAPGARVVLMDNRWVAGSSSEVSRSDKDGNTYQLRPLPDGSRQEVLKNFPTAAQAIAALGPNARDAQWLDFAHYWVLHYRLAETR
jgi:demethylmenaquinone methyltransferase/2-methoxy-6-polyprenyl-1,4-benzoquinol methylase